MSRCGAPYRKQANVFFSSFSIYSGFYIFYLDFFRKLLISSYLTKCFSFEQFLIEIYFTELVYFTLFSC